MSALVEGALGEAVGKLYVERHFPAAAKERMVELVANLVEAYRQSIGDAGLDEPGHPRAGAGEARPSSRRRSATRTKWKDYSALEIRADDLLGNVRRAGAWRTDYELARSASRSTATSG